jgi:hypothetical protein
VSLCGGGATCGSCCLMRGHTQGETAEPVLHAMTTHPHRQAQGLNQSQGTHRRRQPRRARASGGGGRGARRGPDPGCAGSPTAGPCPRTRWLCVCARVCVFVYVCVSAMEAVCSSRVSVVCSSRLEGTRSQNRTHLTPPTQHPYNTHTHTEQLTDGDRRTRGAVASEAPVDEGANDRLVGPHQGALGGRGGLLFVWRGGGGGSEQGRQLHPPTHNTHYIHAHTLVIGAMLTCSLALDWASSLTPPPTNTMQCIHANIIHIHPLHHTCTPTHSTNEPQEGRAMLHLLLCIGLGVLLDTCLGARHRAPQQLQARRGLMCVCVCVCVCVCSCLEACAR